MSKIDVVLNASVAADGSIVCDIDCDGQQARLTFNGTEVLLVVPEPARVTP